MTRMFTVSALLGVLISMAHAAETLAPSVIPTENPRPPVIKKPSAAELKIWRENLRTAIRPNNTCYTARYPDTQWHETTCKPAVQKPTPPKRRAANLPEIVGGSSNSDWIVEGLQTIGGSGDVDQFTMVEGSFDPKTTVTSECNVPCDALTDLCKPNLTCSSAGAEANSFSLQLNAQVFYTQTCAGAPSSECQGWQQFTYATAGSIASMGIQYWLISYGPYGSNHCPNGFSVWAYQSTPSDPSPPIDCYLILAWGAQAVTATMLPQITLTGIPGIGSSNDSVTVTVDGSAEGFSGQNMFPDLNLQWWNAEFNVFGEGDNSQAVFGKGSTVLPRVNVSQKFKNGTIACFPTSFTGETNSLTMGQAHTSQSPAFLLNYTESNPAPSTSISSCGPTVLP
jgi:hypothetical protein